MTQDAREHTGRGAIRALVEAGDFEAAWRLLRVELLAGADPAVWSLARNVLRAGAAAGWGPPAKRQVRLAILCTYEAAELCEQLRIACAALELGAELYVAPYGQVEQEVLDAGSGLADFAPTHVLIAPTSADLALEDGGTEPDAAVTAAARRWLTLWETLQHGRGARVIQHSFVVPDETPYGHLAARLESSLVSQVRRLNARLAADAANDVLLVDCERLAARLGKHRWSDPRLWYATRQPVSHEALPVLALETAAVLAADVGLAARCLVVDLDNTLWGGIVGEDGLDGIAIGEGPDGEAYAAFQDYVGALARRGIVLAVASKNDMQAAREPFESRPGMRLTLDDFSMFVADWRRKPEQIAEISETLGLGLDAIVFADDNPAECAEVAAALPEVWTVCLDGPPSERVRTLDACVRFEVSALSAEDEQRKRSYAARAGAATLRAGAATVEDFLRSLQMRARVRAVDSSSLDRAAQLAQKTNQFNLTLRRHSRQDIERLAGEETTICRTLELDDCFASHGMIGLAIAVADEEEPDTALIDTLLLSCRVIGRTAEVHMLSHLSAAALERRFSRMRGVYVPGPRNALVADLYPRLGFTPCEGDGAWEYDLAANGPIQSGYISDEQ